MIVKTLPRRDIALRSLEQTCEILQAVADGKPMPKQETGELGIIIDADSPQAKPGEPIDIPFTITGVEGATIKVEATAGNPDFTVSARLRNESQGEIKFTAPEEIIQNKDVIKMYSREVNRLNSGLGETEKVKKHVLVADEWTVANGMLTPTLKVRRKVVMQHYNELIDSLFEQK